MIWRRSKLNIVDSCGGVTAQCVGFFKKNNFNFSKCGNFIQVSVIKSFPRAKKLKGKLQNSIVVISKKNNSRMDNSNFFFFQNNCVLLKKRLTTIGSLTSGPTQYTIKRKRFVNSFAVIV